MCYDRKLPTSLKFARFVANMRGTQRWKSRLVPFNQPKCRNTFHDDGKRSGGATNLLFAKRPNKAKSRVSLAWNTSRPLYVKFAVLKTEASGSAENKMQKKIFRPFQGQFLHAHSYRDLGNLRHKILGLNNRTWKRSYEYRRSEVFGVLKAEDQSQRAANSYKA